MRQHPFAVRPQFEVLEDRQLLAGNLSVAGTVVEEAAASADFLVTRSVDLSDQATVEFRTINGSALGGLD